MSCTWIEVYRLTEDGGIYQSISEMFETFIHWGSSILASKSSKARYFMSYVLLTTKRKWLHTVGWIQRTIKT